MKAHKCQHMSGGGSCSASVPMVATLHVQGLTVGTRTRLCERPKTRNNHKKQNRVPLRSSAGREVL